MAKYIIIYGLAVCVTISVSCTKKSDETGKIDSVKTTTGEKTTAGDKHQTAVSDTAFFWQWNGKKLILEDFYKYSENEKTDYFEYGDKMKQLVKKYDKYSEQKPDYYFAEFKEDFAPYTSLKPGRKIYISTAGGVFPVEVNGYYINLDDMIGGGAIFYAAADVPSGASFSEYEAGIGTYNTNMTKSDTNIVKDQGVLDKYKSVLMPMLKGVTLSEYDEKTNKEVKKKLENLKNEDIKIFKGSFTAAGKDEYLVSVKFYNDPTNFTNGVWIMDESGKILNEVSPLVKNNFTYSEPYRTVDFNGDGILEIITNDGYYEGGGYNLLKLKGGKFEIITTGFLFGV